MMFQVGSGMFRTFYDILRFRIPAFFQFRLWNMCHAMYCDVI